MTLVMDGLQDQLSWIDLKNDTVNQATYGHHIDERQGILLQMCSHGRSGC
jgi:hypothetical protein